MGLYWTAAAALLACAAIPEADAAQAKSRKKSPKPAVTRPAAADPAAELNLITEETAQTERKLAANPRNEGLRQRHADLAIRAASGLERVLATGDDTLAEAYREVLVKRFTTVRPRIRRMADSRNGEAAHALAVFALHGIVEPQNTDVACAYFEHAVSTGFNGARLRTAQCLAQREPKRSASLLRAAADTGNPWALELIGRECLEASPTDAVCAGEMLLGAAVAGRPSAQGLLGWMLAQGIGNPPDLPRAARLYRQAAEKGVASAQNNLGELYESGRGIPVSAVDAINWYRKSAEAGFAPGQFNYGRALAGGLGGTADFLSARAWLAKAEAGGVAEARKVLDWMDRQQKTD
jgi:TPR repeat protein